MKTEFKYQLDQSSRKFICPACGKKRFVRYKDAETGEYLPEQYGRCDREVNCAYSCNPYKDGFSRNEKSDFSPVHWTPPPPEPPKEPSYINQAIFEASLRNYPDNHFLKWLGTIFSKQVLSGIIEKYKIGTSKHWPGATVFWQIDQAGKIRSGKIMGYNPTTGRRIKEPTPQITWVHKALKLEPFNLQQCFFGLHLINKEPQKPIALVESEKTAIVASVYLPKFIWLAAGSLANINPKKSQALTGRNIVLFPDLGGFEKWSQKAETIQKELPEIKIKVSDLLETNATDTDRQAGFDLADYLQKFDLKDFIKAENQDLKTQIENQIRRLNPEMWIINPEKFPKITAYNLEVLSQDLSQKNNIKITPQEYFRTYQETFKN